MNAVLAIARRETSAYFATPVGWLVLCAFVFIAGIFFFAMMLNYSSVSEQAMFNPYQADQVNVNEWIIKPLFGNMGVITLMMTPALTMGLLAADMKQKSMELLLTSPITSLQIVLGKYLGVLGFAAVLALGTVPLLSLVYWLGEPDTGIVLSNLGSFFLLLATFTSVGIFASSLTENQLVALALTFVFLLMVWILGWLSSSMGDGALKTVIDSASMLNHTEQMGKGLIRVEDILYFFSFIGFFLFATVQRVEALRWR